MGSVVAAAVVVKTFLTELTVLDCTVGTWCRCCCKAGQLAAITCEVLRKSLLLQHQLLKHKQNNSDCNYSSVSIQFTFFVF